MNTVRLFILAPLWVLLTASPDAKAVITVSSVDQASVVDITATGNVTIYGGIAGALDRCVDGSSTTVVCDNCKLRTSEPATLPLGTPDDLLLACNQRRINPNVILNINISSDALDGRAVITSSDGATTLTPAAGPATVTKGTPAAIQIAWSQICNTIIAADTSSGGSASPCVPVNGAASGTLRVGISSDGDDLLNQSTDDVKTINFVIRNAPDNPTTTSLAENCASAGSTSSICYFEVGPGDEKAVVRTLIAPTGSSFPTTENTQFKFVRFLFSNQGFNYIHLASSYVDLPISSTGTSSFDVSPRRIEGLVNDTTYYFKNALVDAAGNVGLYSKAANDTTCESSPVATTQCRVVTPSEVVGILAETNCFIATAAYGSSFAPELTTLRDFRDQVLTKSAFGKKMIRWYYDVSPRFAKMILESDSARFVVRTALLPTVWFAGVVLAYGPLKAGLGFLAALIALCALFHLGRNSGRSSTLTKATPGATSGAESEAAKKSSRRSLLPSALFPFLGPALLAAALAGTLGASPAEAQSTSVEALEDETPPEPEYPYPGAAGTQPLEESPQAPKEESDEAFADDSKIKPTAPIRPAPVAKKAPARWPPPPRKIQAGPWQRPKAVDEEGGYKYETTAEPEVKKYGRPKAKKFSNLPGREKPATISADGEFTYPVGESDFTGAGGIRFGVVSAPKIVNSSNGLTFKDIYGEADLPALIFEYEYPLTRSIGRVGVKFEAGFIGAQAAGRFKNPSRLVEVPEERFTFLMVPFQTLIHYRFQYSDTQFFVPFAEAGVGYSGIVELRDDGKAPKVGGAPATVVGGGVNILLDWLDRSSVRQLDADYGINHVWFTAQYRQIVSLKEDINVSSRMISAGFTFDF